MIKRFCKRVSDFFRRPKKAVTSMADMQIYQTKIESASMLVQILRKDVLDLTERSKELGEIAKKLNEQGQAEKARDMLRSMFAVEAELLSKTKSISEYARSVSALREDLEELKSALSEKDTKEAEPVKPEEIEPPLSEAELIRKMADRVKDKTGGPRSGKPVRELNGLQEFKKMQQRKKDDESQA